MKFSLSVNIVVHVILWTVRCSAKTRSRGTTSCPFGPWEIHKLPFCGLVTGTTGDVIMPGDDDYADAAAVMNVVIGNYPRIVVVPETIEDIRLALAFAKDQGIRPTIASSGHDFEGRSSGRDTLHINMRNFNSLSVNLNDPKSDSGASVKMGPAIKFMEMYQELDAVGMVGVGGVCPTVAAGGFLQGGGHSILSPRYGMGVDNVIGFTMVTADGRLVNATSQDTIITDINGEVTRQSNGDLFWAVRGGLGGTWGVITEFHYKIHPAPAQWIFATVVYRVDDDRGNFIGNQIFEKFFQWSLSPEMEKRSMGCYLSHINYPHPLVPMVTQNGLVAVNILYFGSWEEGSSVVQEMIGFEPELQISHMSLVLNITNFWDYARTFEWDDDHVGYEYSRIIQPEDVETVEKRNKLTMAMTDITRVQARMFCFLLLTGEGTRSHPVESASINPSYRTSVYTMLCGTYTTRETFTRDIMASRNHFLNIQQFGEGVYPNEPGYFLPNDVWKTEYWGHEDRYNRLLDIKQTWDPDHLFNCDRCVGSDLYNGP